MHTLNTDMEKENSLNMFSTLPSQYISNPTSSKNGHKLNLKRDSNRINVTDYYKKEINGARNTHYRRPSNSNTEKISIDGKIKDSKYK
jgi:hypothetical protein